MSATPFNIAVACCQCQPFPVAHFSPLHSSLFWNYIPHIVYGGLDFTDLISLQILFHVQHNFLQYPLGFAHKWLHLRHLVLIVFKDVLCWTCS